MTRQHRSVSVKRTYLQMLSPSDLNPAKTEDERVRIEQAALCPASFYRYLYTEVGRSYHWTDRLGWTDEEIRAHLDQPSVTLWVMYYQGTPAGYFELRRCAEDNSTEIAYFGLLPEFTGRGLGKHLLTSAVERAWSSGAVRVWLHTCTLDDRAALSNYLKRGFQPFKEESYMASLTDEEWAALKDEVKALHS
ncbi:MAG TPA: GNAT family N-acetyltransferase [Pyrinomonadaceae bacterium]|jgi:GNAT superfamily N-acetyltransferase